MRPLRPLLVLVSALLVATAWMAAPAQAVPDDDDRIPGQCRPQGYALVVDLALIGLPLANTTVRVEARNAKLTPVGVQDRCYETLLPVPRFRWTTAGAPPGQSPAILDGNTLSPGVALRGPGTYVIRLTACPSGCIVRGQRVGPVSRELRIQAVETIALPPETAVTPPPFDVETQPTPYPDSLRDRACLGGGGVTDPQWVTTRDFRSPADYRLVEGRVEKSWISSNDNFLNHDSQDHNFSVEPDPPYRFLVSTKPEFVNKHLLGIEWEVDSFPTAFRPTPGDRVSAFGFHIFDCGHAPFYTEIHPPVGIAVQRPRSISIPTSFRPPGFPQGFGFDVRVPGVMTHLRFSRTSGETTRNCSRTGLHQPARPGLLGGKRGDCIKEPHSLDRVFTFNIYLPRNPQVRMREDAGVTVPPVPLYTSTGATSDREPTLTLRERDGVSWLQVDVDLRGYTGSVYERRITAGWALPAPNNWDLRTWRVRLDSMDVSDDAEPLFDDGDWRVFFNTNNRDREWTKIIDCDGCIDDDETVELGDSTGGNLGRDVDVFPDQAILVHTTGFDDELLGDDTGTVANLVTQATADSTCRRSSDPCEYTSRSVGGSGAYKLNYEIRPARTPAPARLTTEAQALFDAYVLRGTPPCRPLNPRICAVLPGQHAALDETWNQRMVVLDGRPLSAGDMPLYKPQEREEFALTGISTRRLDRVLDRLRARNRSAFNNVLAELREEIKDVPARQRADLYPLVAALDKALPDPLLDRALPRKVDPDDLRPFRLHVPESE